MRGFAGLGWVVGYKRARDLLIGRGVFLVKKKKKKALFRVLRRWEC